VQDFATIHRMWKIVGSVSHIILYPHETVGLYKPKAMIAMLTVGMTFLIVPNKKFQCLMVENPNCW
jgi:hypothetical protein